MKRILISICLITVLIIGFGTANGAQYSLQKIQAEHISELSKKTSEILDLCQYAETKFEKRYCYKNALEIKKDWAFKKLTKDKQKSISELVERLEPEFNKK